MAQRFTVRSIKIGTDGLDAKRAEIKAVLGAIVGHARKVMTMARFRGHRKVVKTGPSYVEIRLSAYWRLTAETKTSLAPWIYLTLDNGSGNDVCSWSPGGQSIADKNVQGMHAVLQQFIDAMLQDFPEVAEAMEPLMVEAEERGEDSVSEWSKQHPLYRGEGPGGRD